MENFLTRFLVGDYELNIMKSLQIQIQKPQLWFVFLFTLSFILTFVNSTIGIACMTVSMIALFWAYNWVNDRKLFPQSWRTLTSYRRPLLQIGISKSNLVLLMLLYSLVVFSLSFNF